MEGNAVLFILVLYPMIMAAAAYVMGRKGKEGGVKAAIAAGVIEFALVAGTVLLLGKADLYVPQVCGMVDTFLARGYTYFDTAYFYHGGKSECAVRDALVKRHSRESFLLADKLPLMHLKDADSGEAQARIFHEQLEKCGVDYFDYYLLHSLTAESYETAGRLDTFAFLSRMKEEGKIRRLGFSFHDKADVLDRVLTEHPEAEFVQLQINYLDWEDERVQSRKCYETVRRHGKQVVVMEPVKGGKLAKLPEEAAAILRQAHPDWSPASWAIRFAAGLEGVVMVLSGMSTLGQVEENTQSMIEQMGYVKTGMITYAVRDTVIDDKEIKQGDYMGIGDSGILSSGPDMLEVTLKMVADMMAGEKELISIYYGSEVTEKDAESLSGLIAEKYPECDLELQYGGQPIYYYIISAE